MNLLAQMESWFVRNEKPDYLRRGELRERAAEKHLRPLGLKVLARNLRLERGEIDSIFQGADC